MSCNLERFRLGLVRHPARAPEDDEEILDRLQAEYLAFLDGLRDEGLVADYGPVIDQPDPSLRGLVLYRTATLEYALARAAEDPLVIAGPLAPEGMTFLAAPGGISAPGAPVTLD